MRARDATVCVRGEDEAHRLTFGSGDGDPPTEEDRRRRQWDTRANAGYGRAGEKPTVNDSETLLAAISVRTSPGAGTDVVVATGLTEVML